MDLIIFPGKNTPIKRYRSYFPKCNLREITDDDEPDVILCHSIGIINALNHCIEHKLSTTIVCMDGVEIKTEIPNNIHISMFRPVNKHVASDTKCEVIYYDIDHKMRHHPYMVKKVRDKILFVLKSTS